MVKTKSGSGVGDDSGAAVDANSKQQAGATGATDPAVSPEVAEKINAMRTRFSATFSQVVISLMSTARYRHQSIADLEHLVTEPLMRNRIAIASAKPTDGLEQGQMVGLAYWAKVNEEVEDKIKEQIKNAVLPIRLKPEEWESGDRLWLLDVVAPNRQAATAVLANFRQVADGGNVALHRWSVRWLIRRFWRSWW
ncbi:MAG: toxin-activating lysine-acyltransferase [Hyphomicrobiales bacterium]|nr:toxin-activating lysine-acyltransferase [Hyphomicrobiales bacterium]